MGVDCTSMAASDPSAPQPVSPDRAPAIPAGMPPCITAAELAKRWGKTKWTIHRMNQDPEHPLKAAAFSKRPLYFPLRLVEAIESGAVRYPQP